MKRRYIAWIMLLCLLFNAPIVYAEEVSCPLTDLALQEESLVALNDTLYAIVGDTFYRLQLETSRATPLLFAPDAAMYLTAFDGQVFGVSASSWNVYVWTPQSVWQHIVQLESDDLTDTQLLDFAVSDTMLYLLAYDFSASCPQLFLFQRDSGQVEAIVPTPNVLEIASYMPRMDGAACLWQSSDDGVVYGLFTDNGDFKQIGIAPEATACALTTDGEEYWFLSNGIVYYGDMDGDVSPVLRLTSSAASSNHAAVANEVYYYVADGQLLSAETLKDVSTQETLVISSIANQDIHEKALNATGLHCENRNQVFFWQDQLSEMLLRQDDSIDIYFFDAAFLDGTAIFDKHYAYPLNTEYLQTTITRMHEPLRTLVERDSELLALPVFARPSAYNLVVNLNVLSQLEAMGYTLPTTYEEFLLQVASWPEDWVEAGFLPYQKSSRSLIEHTLYQLLLYTDSATQIDRDFLVRLLTLTQDALLRLEECQQFIGETDNCLMLNARPLYHVEQTSGCRYLCLPLFSDDEVRLGLEVSFMFVNPYSHHKADAVAYLEAYAAHFTPEAEDELYADANHILDVPGYAENRQVYLQQLENMQAQLDATKDENARLQLENQLTLIQEGLQEFDAMRYTVDEASLNTWQELMAHGKVVAWAILQDSSVTTMIRRFADNESSPEQFADQFLRMLQMRELEAP